MRSAYGSDPGRAVPRIADAGLLFFYVFTAVTVLGYATFGVNPGLVVRYPWAAPIYGPAFQFFAIGHIVVAGLAILLLLWTTSRLRWVAAFAVVYLISLAAELMGTGTGLPFGEYRYTEALGWMWFAHVPALIPLSWFFMALPSYAIARQLGGRAQGAVGRVLLASLLLLSWDLALDPAMSYATSYWVWGQDGPYYGMPWLNLFGWYVTGLAIMAALEAMRSWRWTDGIPRDRMVGFYVANLALPLGMCAAAGLWLAVAATVGVLGVVLLLTARAEPARVRLLWRGGAVADGVSPR
jgi:uncharacterized membrane protein